MPKVSVCIPAYNQVKYLRRTIDSVLDQRFSDYEIIITDDSTTNVVEDLVNEYNLPGVIRYYRNRPSLGTPENWNEAIRKATGEYIKILHHDDWFTNNESLGEFVKLLDEHPESDFAFSASLTVSIELSKSWVHFPNADQLSELRRDPAVLFFGNLIGAPSAVIHRNNKSISYDPALKWVVDMEFYVRQLKHNSLFAFIEKPLVTIISGDQHNVTNFCIDDKNVQVFEYLYFFKKITALNRYLLLKQKYLLYFDRLFSRYNVRSVKEVRETGFKGLAAYLQFIFLLKKMKPVLKLIRKPFR